MVCTGSPPVGTCLSVKVCCGVKGLEAAALASRPAPLHVWLPYSGWGRRVLSAASKLGLHTLSGSLV
eukprot:10733870-Heterocapsa_arctica.AAC.1